MSETVNLNRLTDPLMFDRNESYRTLEVMNKSGNTNSCPMPENSAVLLSVGFGSYTTDAPFNLMIGRGWNNIIDFASFAQDLLSFTDIDQVSIRIVQGNDIDDRYPIQETLKNLLCDEIENNSSWIDDFPDIGNLPTDH